MLANDTDIDGGLKAVESVTQGTHGTVAIVNEGGKLTYRPERATAAPTPSPTPLNGGSSATVTVAVACLEQTTGIVELSTSPSLVPLSFDRTVDDYVLRCNNNKPVEVTAFVAPGYTVRIAGQAPVTGSVQTTVPLKEDLEFIVTVSRGDGEHRYHVRCLPSDFPAWEYVRFDPPSHRFYVVAPTLGVDAAKLVIIFDDHGVPVWWYEASETPFDAKVFPDGTIGWTQGTVPLVSAEIHELDGELIRSFHAVPQADMDWHDLQELPNGDFLVLSYPIRDHVDLTPYGGGEDDEVFDGEVAGDRPPGQRRLVMGLQGPHRPRRDRPLVPERPVPRAGRRPGHRPHQRGRARRPRRVPDLPPPHRRRLQDRQGDRQRHLEAGRDDDAEEPDRPRRPLRQLPLGGQHDVSPAAGRHGDHPRQRHRDRRPRAAGGEVPDRRSRR